MTVTSGLHNTERQSRNVTRKTKKDKKELRETRTGQWPCDRPEHMPGRGRPACARKTRFAANSRLPSQHRWPRPEPGSLEVKLSLVAGKEKQQAKKFPMNAPLMTFFNFSLMMMMMFTTISARD